MPVSGETIIYDVLSSYPVAITVPSTQYEASCFKFPRHVLSPTTLSVQPLEVQEGNYWDKTLLPSCMPSVVARVY